MIDLTCPSIGISEAQFDEIERKCQAVRFAQDQRREINETIRFWGEHLQPRRRCLGPVASGPPDRPKTRDGRRMRRLGLIRELALHYEIAGGRPARNGWHRSSGTSTGFACLLEEVYGVLPPNVRPPTVGSFVRDAERVGFRNSPWLDQRGGSPERAAYLLRARQAWWRSS